MHHTPGGHPGIHRAPSGVGSYVFTTFAVVMVAALLFLVYLWFSERDMLVQRRQTRRGSARALVIILVIALVASVLSRFHQHFHVPFHHRKSHPAVVHPGVAHATKKKHSGPVATHPPQFKWIPVFLATAAGMAVLGFIIVRQMRRERRGLDERYLLERELESLLDDTLADLYAMRDPRQAIIAAYARMERLFATSGLPRRESEAPVEYLQRALGELRASAAALRRLTALFEWAKFSHHEVTGDMREEAIQSLTLVRDELKANRAEDEWRLAQAREEQRERADDSDDRTFGENPFTTVGDKVRGDPNTIR